MAHPLLPTITRIIARQPAATLAQGITTSAHLGVPDYARTQQQHAQYIAALRSLNLDVTLLAADERFPDGHFVEDALVLFSDVALVCRSGAAARQGEATTLRPYLDGMRVFEPEPGAFIDGGDVLFCADRVLVGLSARTNMAGVGALRAALQTVKPDIRVDAVAFDNVLHLKTGLTELAPGVLLCNPALRTDYDLSWAEIVMLPEAEGYAANAVPINDAVLIPRGYPAAREAAQSYYETVIELDMSEFQKMDGGLSCLSLRF